MQEIYSIRGRGRGRGRGQSRGRGRGYFVPSSPGSVHTSSSVFRVFSRTGCDGPIGGYCDGFESDSGYRWFDDGDSPQSCPEPSQTSGGCAEQRAYPFEKGRSLQSNLHEEYDACRESGEYDLRNGPSSDARGACIGSFYAITDGHTEKGEKDRPNFANPTESNGNRMLNSKCQESSSEEKASVPGNWRYQDPESHGIASSLDCCHVPGRVFERVQKEIDCSVDDDHGRDSKQGLGSRKGIMKQTAIRTSFVIDSNCSNQWGDADNDAGAKDGEKHSLNCNTIERKNDLSYDSGNFRATNGRTSSDSVNSANSLFTGGKTDSENGNGRVEGTTRNRVKQTGCEDDSCSLVHDSVHNLDPCEESSKMEQTTKTGGERVNPREGFTARECHSLGNNAKIEVALNLCHRQTSRDPPKAEGAHEPSTVKQWTHGPRTSVIETQDPALHNNPQAVSSIVSEIVAQMNLSQTTPITDPRNSADSFSRGSVAPTVEFAKDYHDGRNDIIVKPCATGDGSDVVPSVLRTQEISRNGLGAEIHPNSSSNEVRVKGVQVNLGNSGPRELTCHNKINPTHENPPTPFASGPLQGLCTNVLNGIVKIYVTQCIPNYSTPWQMCRQTQSTSSGFIISGRRIITNARTVHNHTVVRVKKHAGDRKYIARVLAMGVECDLALLTIAEDEFWQDTTPLQFGQVPEVQARVSVVGYSTDSRSISVLIAAVLHVGIQDYAQGANQLLGIQINTVIATGIAGAPALNGMNEVVGIASQPSHTCDSGNAGHLVAERVIDHFLRDFQNNGKYTGFCHCGFHWQKMENIGLRKSMKMADNDNGILVRRVHRTSSAFQVLRVGDVVTAIDGIPVSNTGTVPYRSGEQISFHYIISNKFIGDLVRLLVLRQGKCTEITYKLGESAENRLVPVHELKHRPEYFVTAGLVFVALSEPYLIAEYGGGWDLHAPVRLLERLLYGSKERKDEQIVVLSQVLNAEINVGYECVRNAQVHRFNDVQIRNLVHLAQLVGKCSANYLRFDLGDEVVVISREESIKASPAILDTHCVAKAHHFER